MASKQDQIEWEAFNEARIAYRKGEIGDTEYLEAREKWDENQRRFDEARGETPKLGSLYDLI